MVSVLYKFLYRSTQINTYIQTYTCTCKHTYTHTHTQYTHIHQSPRPSLPLCWLASKMSYGWTQEALCSHLWGRGLSDGTEHQKHEQEALDRILVMWPRIQVMWPKMRGQLTNVTKVDHIASSAMTQIRWHIRFTHTWGTEWHTLLHLVLHQFLWVRREKGDTCIPCNNKHHVIWLIYYIVAYS